MVEIKEVAIIFKKTWTEDGEEIFTPIEVVEGSYDEIDDVFVTEKGDSYRHIADYVNTANTYGMRKSITKLISLNNKRTLTEIKEIFLEKAKEYTYIRNGEKGYCIQMKHPETGKFSIFKDKDAEKKYMESERVTREVEEVFNKAKTKSKPKEKPELIEESQPVKISMAPKEIVDLAKRRVKGQDKALKRITTLLHASLNLGVKNKNQLIIGPSGVGKTFIFENLSKILNMDLVIYPIFGTTQSGYAGSSIDDMLEQIYISCDKDIERTEKCIVVLDEIDKLAKSTSSQEEIGSAAVQKELLKIIEGTKKLVGSDRQRHGKVQIDTSKMIFIGVGAFQELFEDKKRNIGFGSQNSEQNVEINNEALKKYGFIKEFIGRLGPKTQLEPLTKETLKEIILNPEESDLIRILNYFDSLDISVKNLDKIIDDIAEDALKRDVGARGIIEVVMDMFEVILYDVTNNEELYEEIILGPNIMNDNTDYILIERKQRKVRKRVVDQSQTGLSRTAQI